MNGQIFGICKITYPNGDLYEGEVKDGMREGIGMMIFSQTNERYEGQWIKDQMTGFGNYFYSTPDHRQYSGQFYHGELYGNGVIQTTQFVYKGTVKNGLFDGFGRYQDLQTGLVYEGNFKDGQMVEQTRVY